MDFSIFNNQEKLPQQMIDILASMPVDYLKQETFIKTHKGGPTPWEGGGVLLPLAYQLEIRNNRDPGEFVLLLNKRSKRLPQGGDLCAPGGRDHPLIDSITQKILNLEILPRLHGPALGLAKGRGKEAYELILYYLANALRESWEEIHLSPFNVEFLGPLPTYKLQSRRWIIFPLVGKVREKWGYQLSPEVEKIVPIPLPTFYNPQNYALYALEIPQEMVAKGIANPWVFPCLIQEEGGEEEILWGATFNIIRMFLKNVFPFPLPSPDGKRVIRRTLLPHYLSGDQIS
jgi:8-oxo-dGTP pyrophosphatase MutT (NUDIX family)